MCYTRSMEDVAKFPGLMTRKRSRMWYFRATVPRGLRGVYGRSQIWVSLGTEDRSKAEIAWYEASARMRDQFDRKQFELANPGVHVRSRPETRQQRLRRARNTTAGSGPLLKLTRSAATELARRWFRKQIADHWAGTPDDQDRAISDARSMLGHLSDPDDVGTITATQDAAFELVSEFGYEGDVGQPEFDHLTELLRQAMLELERLHLERLETGEDKVLRAQLFSIADTFGGDRLAASVQPSGTPATLKRALAEFAKAASADRSPSDQEQASKVEAWHEVIRTHFGDDFDVRTMKAPHVESYLGLVARLPANRRKKYPKLSVSEAVEAGERDDQKPISDRVQADYERELRRFVRWCRRNDLLTSDPFELLEPTRSRSKGRKRRTPYEIEELRALFRAPLYTGCKDDERGFNRPGSNHPRRGRFWLPLLGLFSGARAGELCQLRVQDVKKTKEGTPYLSVRNDEEWMSVKTSNAIRDVPLHPELVKIGFLEFVEQHRRSEDQRLFPEMIVEGQKPSQRFSKLFATFLRTVGLKREGLVFHSFRHTARQALRRADLFREAGHRADEKIDDVFGWSDGKGMASRYGGDYPVDQLAKLVELIEYPGLDLSHLHQSA